MLATATKGECEQREGKEEFSYVGDEGGVRRKGKEEFSLQVGGSW